MNYHHVIYVDIAHLKRYINYIGGYAMRRFICFILIIITLLSFAFGEEGLSGMSEARENLTDMTQEEKKVLEELFIIVQSIKETENIQESTKVEIENLRIDIKNMEAQITEQEKKYDDNLHIMEEILKNYQKNGATSYLNLILSSDSLHTLLRRINIIRDISRSTNTLLEDLEAAKAELIEDKAKIEETLDLVEERQKQLEDTLMKSNALKNNLELKLASLQEDKSKYESYLNNLETTWKEIKPLFSNTISMLVRTIEEGNVPDDTILLSNISLISVTGTISETKFKNILKSLDFPTKVDIELSDGKIELIMPEIEIYMSGTLEIMDNKQSLIFNMEQGSYMGMKLEKSALEELFSFGYLELNFKSMLGRSTIKSIKIKDDSLELKLNPVLF
jgi:peptidoglycan hydrolase CwlO-like protein